MSRHFLTFAMTGCFSCRQKTEKGRARWLQEIQATTWVATCCDRRSLGLQPGWGSLRGFPPLKKNFEIVACDLINLFGRIANLQSITSMTLKVL